MEEIANKINKLIKESESYKRYLAYKENINNDYLNELKEKMELLKKENCKEKKEELVEEYYLLEKEYKSDVLVKEYELAKQELYLLLKDICDILAFK